MAPKKGKKAAKALKHSKKLETTRPLSRDIYLQIDG